jgi:SAM-dependent methyltransferase
MNAHGTRTERSHALQIKREAKLRNHSMTSPSSPVHPTASDGYTTAADNYVRGRPDYPAAIVDWLRNALGLDATRTVVDLGAGTGKFTPRLIETGAQVIAVEPVEQMLGKLSSALPQVEALTGSACSIPLPDASVDAVVCAQSFHWFARTEALAEIHRVLTPGGKLGLVWNMRDARVGWVARLDRIVNRIEGDTPRYYTGAWRTVFPFKGLGPLHEQHFSIGHTGSPEDVIVNRIRSISFIAALAPQERARIEDEVKALIAEEPALSGRAVVTMPYETAAFHTVKGE